MEDEPKGPLDLATAKPEDLKGRDLSPGLVSRAKAPKPTWFVERLGDGMIFACEELEAWDIINNHSRWKRNDFKFIGHSDGKTYKRVTEENLAGAAKLEPEMDRLKVEIGKYRSAEEKLLINEGVDMEGDPEDAENEANKKRVARIRTILDRLEDQLEEIERQHRDYSADVVKKATQAELKVARENWSKERVWPSDVHILTPNASPRERARILAAMSAGGK